jgi:hypothetical protein
MLGVLHVRPRTKYLAKLRNPRRKVTPKPGVMENDEHGTG